MRFGATPPGLLPLLPMTSKLMALISNTCRRRRRTRSRRGSSFCGKDHSCCESSSSCCDNGCDGGGPGEPSCCKNDACHQQGSSVSWCCPDGTPICDGQISQCVSSLVSSLG